MNTQDQTGPKPTRKEKERMARRQLILDAARIVFSQRGFHAAKLDDVAERAEFGKATLYSYFDTKESLFQAVIEDVFEQLLGRATEAFAGDATFEEKIARYVAGETTFFFGSPEGLHLIMSESGHLRGENPLIRLTPRYTAVLQSAIEQEQKAGRLRSDLDAFELTMTLRMMVFAQFISRINRMMHEHGLVADTYSDAELLELTERIKKVDVGPAVQHATTFITTMFLSGARG